MVFAHAAEWLKELPPSLPAWTVGVGVALVIGLQGYIGLPEEVQKNTRAVEELREYREEDSRKINRMLCIMELQIERGAVELSPLEVQRACP